MWGEADHGHVGQLPVGPERQMMGGLVWGLTQLLSHPKSTASRGLQVEPGLPPGACSPQHQIQHTVNSIGEELIAARPSSIYISDAAMMLNCMQTPVQTPTAGLYGSE